MTDFCVHGFPEIAAYGLPFTLKCAFVGWADCLRTTAAIVGVAGSGARTGN
jgi:hypothetical protein